MNPTVQKYESGYGPIYMHLKKHYCPDCKVQLDTACSTETLTGWAAREEMRHSSFNSFSKEVDVQTKYFFCPKCYRRIKPKEMRMIELQEKNEAKAARLAEELVEDQEREAQDKKRTQEDSRRNMIVTSCCYLIYFFIIGGVPGKLSTCLGIAGAFLQGMIVTNFRRRQEEKKGLIICVCMAVLILVAALLTA